MSLCGCWADVMMSFEATVQDAQTMMPLAGIELSCKGESVPVALSDSTGKLSFTIDTQQSPGCGYLRCNNMVLHSPDGAHMDQEGTYFSLNGQTILMQ